MSHFVVPKSPGDAMKESKESASTARAQRMMYETPSRRSGLPEVGSSSTKKRIEQRISQQGRRIMTLAELQAGEFEPKPTGTPPRSPTQSDAVTTLANPSDLNALPQLTCWPSSTTPRKTRLKGSLNNPQSKSQLVLEFEKRISTKCSESRGLLLRASEYSAILNDLGEVFPSYCSVFGCMGQFLEEMVDQVDKSEQRSQQEIKVREREVFQERERFYQSKVLEILAEKRALSAKVSTLEKEIESMRLARDDELSNVKQELLDIVQRTASEESELSSMRSLVTTIFRENQEMREELQSTSEQNKMLKSGGNYIPIRPLSKQVTSEYMAASQREIDKCRISIEKALVDAALESRSSFRSKVEALSIDNHELQEKVKNLTKELKEVTKRAHEERFKDNTLKPQVMISLRHDRLWESVAEAREVERESALLKQAVGEVKESESDHSEVDLESDEPPSPTEGISSRTKPFKAHRKRPTKETEVCRLEDQLPSVRTQQRARCYTPRPEIPFEIQGVLGIPVVKRTRKIMEELCSVALAQHKELTTMHFDMRKLVVASNWMESEWIDDIAKEAGPDATPFISTCPESEWPTVHHFLRTYVSPHVVNERWSGARCAKVCRSLFENIDSLVEAARELHDSKCYAPKVVNMWDRRKLATCAALDAAKQDLSSLPREAIPFGYIVSCHLRRYSATEVCQSRQPTEIDFATISYNFWAALKRYRGAEPLCELLLQILDGTLPIQLFSRSERLLECLFDKLSATDVVKAGKIPFTNVSKTILPLLSSDHPGIMWRGALHAAVQAFKQSHVPLTERIEINQLLHAEESATVRSSPFVRFLRRHLISAYERFYDRLQTVLEDRVQESTAMHALSVLEISAIIAEATRLDAMDKVQLNLPKASYVHFVQLVVADLPRLNASAHLKKRVETPPDDLQQDPSAGALSPKAASLRKKRKGKGAVQSMLNEMTNDQSLVEWFSFTQRMRQVPPPIIDTLHLASGITVEPLPLTPSEPAPQALAESREN